MHDPDPQPVRQHPGPLVPAGSIVRESITVGPFHSFFSNKNDEMKLKGHSHSCTITLEYQTLASTGFPAFESTYDALQAKIKELLRRPIKGTNEVVARQLWDGLRDFCPPEFEQWGGRYKLHRLTLGVLGVPDDIGHADGWTLYNVWG